MTIKNTTHIYKAMLSRSERLAEWASDKVGTKWKAKVGGREEVSSFDLRVTTTFRKEGSDWKVIHRHADPIASFNADGRTS
jgi:hypothetical protein